MTTLRTIPLANVQPVAAEQVTTSAALPLWMGHLAAIVGEGESGKTWLAAHTAADVASNGHSVLVLDGEMSATAWRRRFTSLSAEWAVLNRVHYAEMGDVSANVPTLRATIAELGARLVIWDSALSLISRTARSENDNAEVTRVYDQLREIVRDGPAGLIVDHTSKGTGQLVSRGASAKFNALDLSYGVKLADGSVPGPHNDWASIVSVEKDRHGLLPERRDRTALFVPLGAGQLAIDISESSHSTHRLATGNPITQLITQLSTLNPPATSGNDAHKRLGGKRSTVLAAFKEWNEDASKQQPNR